MIAKSIKAKSFAGCVNYVMKDDAELLKAEGVMAFDAKSMTTSFELQRSTRPEIKSPAGHIPISFAPEDRERMTNKFMIKLAEEYMERMNIKETQYIIVRHHDGDNEHLHIVYNRINNEKKLISLNNDYKRKELVCKAMKDRYNLTYGKDKSRVKVGKLQGSEQTRHEIFHALKAEIKDCKTFTELQNRLSKHRVTIEFKYRRGTSEVQGISFIKDNQSFKGSKIDRKYSYNGLLKLLQNNNKHQFKHRIPNVLGGIKLTEQQRINLDNAKSIFIKRVTSKDGNLYNAWTKWSEEQDKLQFFKHDPDTINITATQSTHNFRHPIPTKIGNVLLTENQRITLDKGKSVCFKNRTNSQGEKFDVYAVWSAQERKLNFYYEDPCKFNSQQELQQEQPQQPHQQHEKQHTTHYDEPSSGIGLLDLPQGYSDDPEEIQFRNRMQRQQKKRGRRI